MIRHILFRFLLMQFSLTKLKLLISMPCYGSEPFKGKQSVEETDSNFRHMSEAIPETKNEPMSIEKLRAVAKKVSLQNKPSEPHIAPDIAADMGYGEEQPF